MLPIEKIISKTLNLKTSEKSKTFEKLIKNLDVPSPEIKKIAAEADKKLKAFKEGK